jgi:hypothetical protein
MAEAIYQRGVVPPGTYAKGARSPIVYALLCAPCAGYAPTTDPGHDSALSGRCQGCGADSRELHRFQALILSAANGGCRCTTEHPQVTGELPTEESLRAVWWELATRPMSPAQRSERGQALKLLEAALFLRMNGQRPPGAPREDLEAETWHDWDRRAEQFLRSLLPPDGESRESRQHR